MIIGGNIALAFYTSFTSARKKHHRFPQSKDRQIYWATRAQQQGAPDLLINLRKSGGVSSGLMVVGAILRHCLLW